MSVINELAERFGPAEARGILLVPEFTHSDFAEMIASSRPMASKLMSSKRACLCKRVSSMSLQIKLTANLAASNFCMSMYNRIGRKVQFCAKSES